MRTRIIKQFAYMLMDCTVTIASWWLSTLMFAYFLRASSTLLPYLVKGTVFSVLACLIIFYLSGVYKNLWLYPGMGDIIRISFAAVVSNFSIYIFYRYISGFWHSPAIGLLSFYLVLTFSGGIRLMPRMLKYIRRYLERNAKVPNGIPTMIVGAGETTATLLDELMRNGNDESVRYDVRALVDDNTKKHNYILHGVPVMGDCSQIPKIVDKLDIKEIIIAIPTATNEQLNRIVKLCPTHLCKIRIMPKIHNMGQPMASSIRNLNIEDLLGRSELALDISGIKQLIENQVVLVTGGGGSIGSELCRQIIKFSPKALVIFDIYENNLYDIQQELLIKYKAEAARVLFARVGSVQDPERLKEVMDEFPPYVVFHAAAYKHVPLMEQSPELAIQNNVFGTYNVCKAAKIHKAKKFVMISTDKAVNPTNVMGASKRIAERIVQSFNSFGNTEYACVRFGNVLGSNGSVIPLFTKQIEAGGPITVTHPDITRYFMTIPEAAQLVIQAGAMARGGEIFILDMGQPVKILDLATDMIRMAGFVPNVDIKIQVTGLRPGEKLYEELLLSTEDDIKTENEKIFIAKIMPTSVEEATVILDKLRVCIRDNSDMLGCIKDIVPEYKTH